MQASELEAMTRDDLRKLAKERDLPGRGKMTKAQLVEALTGDTVQSDSKPISDVEAHETDVQAVEEVTTAQTAFEGDLEVSEQDNESFRRGLAKERDEKRKRDAHISHVEQAPIGKIVVFRDENGSVKSAKIIKKSVKNRKLKLQTKYGREFVVSFDNVIWVRDGERWPRFVYNMLKGVGDGEENGAQVENN